MHILMTGETNNTDTDRARFFISDPGGPDAGRAACA